MQDAVCTAEGKNTIKQRRTLAFILCAHNFPSAALIVIRAREISTYISSSSSKRGMRKSKHFYRDKFLRNTFLATTFFSSSPHAIWCIYHASHDIWLPRLDIHALQCAANFLYVIFFRCSLFEFNFHWLQFVVQNNMHRKRSVHNSPNRLGVCWAFYGHGHGNSNNSTRDWRYEICVKSDMKSRQFFSRHSTDMPISINANGCLMFRTPFFLHENWKYLSSKNAIKIYLKTFIKTLLRLKKQDSANFSRSQAKTDKSTW